MSLTPKPARPIEIFISYSHKDQGLRDQLETHLSLLKREGRISSWHDRKIGAGEEWAGQIDTHLHTAQIILLLVSPDFMASDYCYDIEMTRALARNDAGEARVIPVILRPVDWRSALFGKLQALPQDAKPITTWQDRDEAFLDVARGIRNLVEETTKSQAVTAHNPPSTHRSILSFPPPTDPRIIQQREEVVKDVYAKLTQPDITAIVLTGIGGLGKSTLAALVHCHAEEERQVGKGPFTAEALWLTIDPAVTLVDLAGTVFEALSKPLPKFANLPPLNQAAALRNALNTVDKPRLIILDQFENLLDWQTGQALPDKPGIGEWLDAINSQPTTCRVLLTSRPWPQGTRAYPPICIQEYPVRGLNTTEGISLLRKQGHALALTLLASILRSNRSLSLNLLFNDPMYASLWTGNIARSLLDYIYTYQLSEAQRKLLQAFSVYRKSVPLDAAQAIIPEVPKAHILPALNVLLNQHLLNAVGNGLYQLHTIVASYAQGHFDESNEQANQEALRAVHGKAAQYYLQQTAKKCPPREKRRSISDVQPLVEATWQYCQAEQWHEAYQLMEQEGIFSDLHRWGNNAILLEMFQLLLPPDKWHSQRSQVANIYRYIGEIYRSLAQKELGLSYSEKALSIYKEIEDRLGEGMVLNNLGRIYNAMGQKDRAREYYVEALSRIEGHDGEATVLNNLGRVYTDLKFLSKAQKCYEDALSVSRNAGNRNEEGRALHGLGMVCSALGMEREARMHYEKALRVLRNVRDRAEEGKILTDLGLLCNASRKVEEALDCSKQALYIHREVGSRDWEGITLNNLGVLFFQKSDYKAALACLLVANDISKEVQEPGHSAAQGWMNLLQTTVGKKQFATLLKQVEPHASQIVEKALKEGL